MNWQHVWPQAAGLSACPCVCELKWKTSANGVFQSCFVHFVSKNIQTNYFFLNLNIVYLAVSVGIIAAGQLVQTGQDSKIDWKLQDVFAFTIFGDPLNPLLVPVRVLTFVALSEMSFFFNDWLGYLVMTCTVIPGQIIEAPSVSPKSGQNFNRKGLIRYVADDSSSNYVTLFSSSCASNFPGMAQQDFFWIWNLEAFSREHFRCSVTHQLPFSCNKNPDAEPGTTRREEKKCRWLKVIFFIVLNQNWMFYYNDNTLLILWGNYPLFLKSLQKLKKNSQSYL